MNGRETAGAEVRKYCLRSTIYSSLAVSILASILYVSSFNLKAENMPSVSKNNKTVLFVAHDDSGIKYFVHPLAKQRLEAEGWSIGERWFSELSPEILSKFNVVVILYECSMESVNNAKDNKQNLSGHIEELHDYINSGGGVFTFFTEGRYTDDFSPLLNKFLEPMGAKVWFESFKESNEQNIHRFNLQNPSYYYSFKTTCLGNGEITKGTSSFWLSHMIRGLSVDSSWDPVVKMANGVSGGKTKTEGMPCLAVRDWKSGRVAVFSTTPSHYWNDGYHLFYDNGWLLKNGDTWKILSNVLDWLAAPSLAKGIPGGFKEGAAPPRKNIGGCIMEPAKIFEGMHPYRGIFGVRTTFSGGMNTVSEFASKARELGLDFIIITDSISDSDSWNKLTEQCASATDNKLVVIPGVEWQDTTGNTGYAVNIEKWPPQDRNLNFIHTMLQTSGNKYKGIYVFANPKANPSHPWETGGVNALEVVTQEAGQIKSMAMEYLERLQPIPGMTLLPVASSKVWSLNELANAAGNGYAFYLMARSLETLRDTPSISFVPGFISSGPVLKKFEADPMVRDSWESYVLWQTGEIVTVAISIESKNALNEVILMSGEKVVRRFFPDTAKFNVEVKLPMAAEGPFYVTATDTNGGKLISYAIATRNMNYWNHVGSDRMNDYHNPIYPDTGGSLMYKGERYSHGGLVTLAFGWGNYFRFYHPATGGKYHPQGYETGQISAGLDNLTTYPELLSPGIPGGTVEPARRQLLATRDVVILEEKFPRVSRKKTDGGKYYLDINGADVSTRIIIFRYRFQPYGYIIVKGISKFTALEDLKIDKKGNNDVFALKMVDISYKGKGKDFNHIAFIDEAGKNQKEAMEFNDKKWSRRINIGPGGYITFTPDPYGLLGIHCLDNGMTVVARNSGQPEIIVGMDFKNNKTLPRGYKIENNWIVTQDGGGEKPELFEELSGLWGLGGCRRAPVYAPADIKGGKLLPEPYIVTIELERDGCMASFGAADKLPNRIIPISVRGVRAEWSAGALKMDRETLSWYPGGVLDSSLWLSIEQEGKYFLGNPLICDDHEVYIDIVSVKSEKIAFTLHNPKSVCKTVSISTAALLDACSTPVQFTLEPGAVVSGIIKCAIK